MLATRMLIRDPMRNGFLPQVALIVWVLWITYYLSRATRSLQQRPYTAFRCREHESRVQHSVRLCAGLLWSSQSLTGARYSAGRQI